MVALKEGVEAQPVTHLGLQTAQSQSRRGRCGGPRRRHSHAACTCWRAGVYVVCCVGDLRSLLTISGAAEEQQGGIIALKQGWCAHGLRNPTPHIP